MGLGEGCSPRGQGRPLGRCGTCPRWRWTKSTRGGALPVSTTVEAEDLEAAGLHPPATGMARRQRRQANPCGGDHGWPAAMASVPCGEKRERREILRESVAGDLEENRGEAGEEGHGPAGPVLLRSGRGEAEQIREEAVEAGSKADEHGSTGRRGGP